MTFSSLMTPPRIGDSAFANPQCVIPARPKAAARKPYYRAAIDPRDWGLWDPLAAARRPGDDAVLGALLR
jgi:hypothetical protein